MNDGRLEAIKLIFYPWVRGTALPTSFKTKTIIMEKLNPWEIDKIFKHASAINDVTKYYKTYTKTMRKFGI